MTTASLYTLFLSHPTITTDSRNVPQNALFFALKGENFNGNHFATQAIENGASFAIIDDPTYQTHERCILVPDGLQALQALATHHRRQFTIPVIAITGSNGKTTTKELVTAVLSRRYHTCSTKGNLNNHIGVPLTLLQLSSLTEIAVVEMGANHPGEIALLCSITQPTHGIITNIGRAHLEGFGNLEGVAQAKTELYRYLRDHKGCVIINASDPLLMQHASSLKTFPYTLLNPSNQPTPSHPNDSPLTSPPDKITRGIIDPLSPTATLSIHLPDGASTTVKSHLFGSYNALNLLAAACIGTLFEVPAEHIKQALESYTPANNRSQLYQSKTNLLVLDAYNANPGSMKAALEALAESFPQNPVAILGDMLELGNDALSEHRQMIETLRTLKLHSLILIGPLFSQVNDLATALTFPSSEEAARWIKNHPFTRCTILLKGSRGMHLEKLIPFL